MRQVFVTAPTLKKVKTTNVIQHFAAKRMLLGRKAPFKILQLRGGGVPRVDNKKVCRKTNDGREVRYSSYRLVTLWEATSVVSTQLDQSV